MAAAFADVGVAPRKSLPGIQSERRASKEARQGSKEREYTMRRVSGTGPIPVPLTTSLQGPRRERSSIVLTERHISGAMTERRSSGAEGIPTSASGNRWRPPNQGGNNVDRGLSGGDEDSIEPVLQLSVGVPAWGVQKSLKMTLTPASFRRVHQRLERFATDAAEREGALIFNRPSPEVRAELEAACSKEFAVLTKRFEAAKELERNRRMSGAANMSTVEQDAAVRMETFRSSSKEAPISAWSEDISEAPASSTIEQLRARAEQLREQLKDAE